MRATFGPVAAFGVSRAALFLVVYLSLVLIPVRSGPGLWREFPQNLFVDGWSRWDSGWFAQIALHGYDNVRLSHGQDTAIFPAYPLAIRAGSALFGHPHVVGIVIANLCFLAALVLLFRLVSDLHDVEAARRTVTLLAFSPFSFFFSAMYSESFFLLAVVGAFYLGERRQWFWAALCAAVAGATRTVGFVMVIGLAALYFEQAEYRWRNIRADAAWLALCFLGPVAHMIYLAAQFGDPLQFTESQKAWNTLNPLAILGGFFQHAFSWTAIKSGEYPALDSVHLAVTVLCAILLALSLRRLRPAYVLWAAAMLLVSLPRWTGMGRYMLVIFPLFITAALLLRGEKWYGVALASSAVFLGLFSIMFSHWYWVA